MGHNAHALVSQNYTWDKIALDLVNQLEELPH